MQGQSTRRPYRPSVIRACGHCGSPFRAKASEIDAGKGLYCSKSCKHASQRTRETRMCRQCGTAFKVHLAEIKKGGGVYCSRACLVEYRTPSLELTQARFWSRVDRSGTCHLMTERIRPDGYANFTIRKQRYMAHRLAYEWAKGPVPDGLDLDHLCHNADPDCLGGPTCSHRRCVNVEHLEPATRPENVLRGKGRSAMNARKTHCPYGHPYAGDNLYIQPSNGGRQCRTCYLEKSRQSAKSSHG